MLLSRKSIIRLLIALTSIHNLVIHQMDVKTTFLNGKLDEEVYMNQPRGFIMPGNENKVDLTNEFLSSRLSMKDMREADVTLVLEGYTDASWISNAKNNSSTSGWVFLLGGGNENKASKKQTCITSLTMESEFVALAATGKEVEWLKNLLLEIILWSKPIASVSFHFDSAATLGVIHQRTYPQLVNSSVSLFNLNLQRVCSATTHVGNKMLQGIPTASYEDPTARAFYHC
nr:zinc finger, CCHC-type [Tanacetum cinerariifolium]